MNRLKINERNTAMEELAHKIARKIAFNLNYDKEQTSIVAYGLIALIQMFTTTLIIVIFGFLFDILTEALILTFSVSLLRKYTGGAHADTIGLCTAISVVYCVGMALVSKHLIAPNLSLISSVLIGLVIFVTAYLVIFKFAPVDSPNKPIRTLTKRKKMRRGAYVVVTAYVIIAALFLYLYNRFTVYWLGCYMSLLLGMIWQISTLTRFGTKFIAGINHIFIKQS